MDIKTTPPEEYAAWLRDLGVAETEIPERMAHDMLRALREQFGEVGVPEGFEGLATALDKALSEDAVARALR